MGRFQHFLGGEELGKWRIAGGLNSVVDRKSSLRPGSARLRFACCCNSTAAFHQPHATNKLPSPPTDLCLNRQYVSPLRRPSAQDPPFTPPSTESQANETTNRRPSSRPRGRLYQVEYALEAISHAGTALGILARDGIVLAAERKVTSKLLEQDTSAEKLYTLNEYPPYLARTKAQEG